MSNAEVKLLIVDDDEPVRESLSQLFTEFRHSVRSVEDGPSALLEIRQEVPDIILSDLNMPGMSGFELLSIVLRFPGIRVIAMSGGFSVDDIPRRLAADAFYEKGAKLSLLLQIVQAMTCEQRSPALHHRPAAPMQNCAELARCFRSAFVQ